MVGECRLADVPHRGIATWWPWRPAPPGGARRSPNPIHRGVLASWTGVTGPILP